MILIFVEGISERLIYTLDFIFKNHGLSYQLTNDYTTFPLDSKPKINYSNRHFDSILQFAPSSVLFDEIPMIYSVNADFFYKEECLTFNGVIDPLASIFFVLSRMEEYTSSAKDEHERFVSTNSVMHRFDWLQKAMCDRWSIAFLNYLKEHDLIQFTLKKSEVKLVPTFDIDNVYAYKLKLGYRKWLSVAKDRLKGNKTRLLERKKVLTKLQKDPYDTFETILQIGKKYKQTKVFWLVGNYAKFDRNVSVRNPFHQRVIRKINQEVKVGLHPSYRSNSFEFYLKEEKQNLEKVLNLQINFSRQHFLKLILPKTYKNLIAVGIEHDYSMGYADNTGFRAGTARPHLWFDLSKNERTHLCIHPFVYMDGTLCEYMNFSPTQAISRIRDLYQEVKRYGGDFSFIWHNETIGDYGKWKGWKVVLDETLNLNKNEC